MLTIPLLAGSWVGRLVLFSQRVDYFQNHRYHVVKPRSTSTRSNLTVNSLENVDVLKHNEDKEDSTATRILRQRSLSFTGIGDIILADAFFTVEDLEVDWCFAECSVGVVHRGPFGVPCSA